MGVNLMCLTSSGGLPIFSRKMGNVEPLSFSTIGSLNGVHMFAKSFGVNLDSSQTENSTVLWKEYEESVVLIVVSLLNEKQVLNYLLDTVFNAMILCVGYEDIKNIKNVERLKRDLRVSYAIIDSILECLDYGDRISSSPNIFNYVETMLCSEQETLLESLYTFVESASSMFGCLTVENCIAAASDGWWELTEMERKLISHVLLSNSNCTAIDVPVFLPCKSPTVPFRLVSICLISSVWVSVLCGPTPDLASIQENAFQIWSPVMPSLKTALQTYPRNIPTSVQIHYSVIGILLINTTYGKFLSCSNLTGNKKDHKSSAEVLKTFLYQAALTLLDNDEKDEPVETYWCAEYQKLHALKNGDNVMCLMFNSTIPTHTMRLLSQQTLSIITSNKDLRW